MSAAEPTAPASALQFSPVTKLRFEWHADKLQSDKNGDQWLPPSDGSIVGVLPSGPPAPPAGYRRIQLRDGDPNTAALSASWARLLEEGFPDCAWTTEKIETSFRSAPTWNPSAVVLAEHVHAPGEVVAAGMAWVDTVGDEWGRVHWVAVSSKHRRQGLGQWLVKSVLHHHVTTGRRNVYLRTEDFRTAAIKLYLGCGFVNCGVVAT